MCRPAAWCWSAWAAPCPASTAAGPSHWSIASGGLPAGLTLSPAGVISGTPIGGGSTPVTVRIDTAIGGATTRAYTLTVSGPPAPNTAPTILHGPVATPATVLLP